jgi:hypothetical protein
MAKRPSLGRGLLSVTGIASIVCIIGGIAVLIVQGPPAETSSGNTPLPAGAIMFIVGFGYLLYGGVVLGIYFLVKVNGRKATHSESKLAGSTKKTSSAISGGHSRRPSRIITRETGQRCCYKCGCSVEEKDNFCKECGASFK